MSGSEQSVVASFTQVTQSMVTVITDSGEKDMPLALLWRKLRKSESKKTVPFRLSREGSPNPILLSSRLKVVGCSPRTCCSECHGLKYLLVDMKIRYTVPTNFNA